MTEDRYSIFYTDEVTSKKMKLDTLTTFLEAKKHILALQFNPSSFFDENPEIERTAPHYLTVETEGQNVLLVGENKDVKITTLGAVSVEDTIDIPSDHILLYSGGIETNSEYETDMVFHIDKREFENMITTVLSVEKGYEYSKLKTQRLQCIMDSRFYNSMREGLEDNLTEKISEVVIAELGSLHTDDKMFEDTERSLLPYFMNKFHSQESDTPLYLHDDDNAKQLKNAVGFLDEKCKRIEEEPPPFLSEGWAKALNSSVINNINHHAGQHGDVDVITYTKPKEYTGKGKKKKSPKPS